MDIFSEIKSYGVINIAAKYGCEIGKGGFSPCPSCGADTRHTKRKDNRPSCIVIHSGNGWRCLQCDQTGDTVDLLTRFLNEGKRPTSSVEWRRVLAGFQSGERTPARGDIATTPSASFSGAARGLPSDSGSMARPPFPDVMRLWQESAQSVPEKVQPWLVNKYPSYTIKQIEETGVARWLPNKDRPNWWPWYHPYMVMLAFDHHGLVQSIHGRIMGDPPPDKPKSRFPKGYSASGLVLGNKTAINWLRGKQTVENVLIAEGLTSTLAATMALKHRWAVFGYTSGSNSCIQQMPWSGQSVTILTDNDKTGDAYADKVLQVLPPNINARRGNLNGR